MNASLARLRPGCPAGITLLEVLISIGILAVGLGGVVALMPAAQSQANRAVVLDRAAVLAANALADAATFGLLRDGTAVISVAATAVAPVIVDPAAVGPYLLLGSGGSGGFAPVAQISAAGVAAPAAAGFAPPAVLRLVTELRDDLTLRDPPGPDDLPLNMLVDGARGYLGRMTCLLCVKPGASPAASGTLSAVVFHGRDVTSPLAVSGTITNFQVLESSLSLADLAGRRMRDVVRSGVVLWDPTNRRFHQVAAAAFDASGATAFLTLQSGTILTGGPYTVQFLPESVGFAERPYVPESTSAFTQ
jgi:hypothetical protein